MLSLLATMPFVGFAQVSGRMEDGGLVARPGETVIIEATRPLTDAATRQVLDQISQAKEDTGVNFVLLGHGLRVAGRAKGETCQKQHRS